MRVLYVDLDCCRSDHLSVNGYRRRTSPAIDAIAADGVSFRRCFAANSPCLPSRASLFSGRFGIQNGVVAHHGPGERFRVTSAGHGRDPRYPMWPYVLWRAGMHTVSLSSFAHRHNAWWFADGWAEQHSLIQGGQETAAEVNRLALPWFKDHAREDNWFVHLHYWDLHSHYRLSQADAARFADEPAPDWPDDDTIRRQFETFYGPRSGRDLFANYEPKSGSADKSPTPIMPDHVSNRAEFKRLIDGYDAAIHHVDRHIAQVLDVLADAGVLDDTAVIFSADHGDSFGEHGQYMDHGIANDAVHNIPLIIRWPGVTHGQGPEQKPTHGGGWESRPERTPSPLRGEGGVRDAGSNPHPALSLKGRGVTHSDALVYGMDLAPTVLDLLGLPTPSGWDARSVAPALRGEPFPGRPYLVMDHGIYTLTRAVRTPDHLLIRMLHPGCYPYDDPVYLHDLNADPHQTVNLAASRPDLVGDLSAKLAEWKD